MLLQIIILKLRGNTQSSDSYHLLKTVIFYSRTHQAKMLLSACLLVLSLICLILSFCIGKSIVLCFLIVILNFLNIKKNLLFLGLLLQRYKYGKCPLKLYWNIFIWIQGINAYILRKDYKTCGKTSYLLKISLILSLGSTLLFCVLNEIFLSFNVKKI